MEEKNTKAKVRESMIVLMEQAKKIKDKTVTSISGKDFVIYPNVFNPSIFVSGRIYPCVWSKLIRKAKAKNVLEIGAGAGYNSILAVLDGAAQQVTSTDVVAAAIENMNENVTKHGLQKQITVVYSDVFDHLDVNAKKFDFIFWSFPWFSADYYSSSIDAGPVDDLERALYDPEYVALEKFITQADGYVSPDGRVFLSFSPTIGDYGKLRELGAKYSWKLERICEEEIAAAKQLDGSEVAENVDCWLLELVKTK